MKKGVSEILIAVLFISVISFNQYAFATEWWPEFKLKNIAKVDTIIVSFKVADRHYKFLPKFPDSAVNLPNPFSKATQELFSRQKWLTIALYQDLKTEQLFQPNVIHFDFSITARQQEINGKVYRLGSIGLQLRKYDPVSKTFYAVDKFPAAYPFVVPETYAELEGILSKGAIFLTRHLPGYFAHVNLNNKDMPKDDTAYEADNNRYQEDPIGPK